MVVIGCARPRREVIGNPVRTALVGQHFTKINVPLPPSNNKLKINQLKFKARPIWVFFFFFFLTVKRLAMQSCWVVLINVWGNKLIWLSVKQNNHQVGYEWHQVAFSLSINCWGDCIFVLYSVCVYVCVWVCAYVLTRHFKAAHGAD